MKTKTKFEATGLVHGNFWGGGEGSYPSRKISAKTKKELLVQANKDLQSGSLDSGMGYQSLIGALLNIKKITTKVIGGKEFVNKEIESEFIGNLTEKQQDFLIEIDSNL